MAIRGLDYSTYNNLLDSSEDDRKRKAIRGLDYSVFGDTRDPEAERKRKAIRNIERLNQQQASQAAALEGVRQPAGDAIFARADLRRERLFGPETVRSPSGRLIPKEEELQRQGIEAGVLPGQQRYQEGGVRNLASLAAPNPAADLQQPVSTIQSGGPGYSFYAGSGTGEPDAPPTPGGVTYSAFVPSSGVYPEVKTPKPLSIGKTTASNRVSNLKSERRYYEPDEYELGLGRSKYGNRYLAHGGKIWDARHGGRVPKGPPGVDTVPAYGSGGKMMLDNGEYVLPADTTTKVGVPALNKLKAMTHDPMSVERRYAGGGPVSADEGQRRAQSMVDRMLAEERAKREAEEATRVPALPKKLPKKEPENAFGLFRRASERAMKYADGGATKRELTAAEKAALRTRDFLGATVAVPVAAGTVFNEALVKPVYKEFVKPAGKFAQTLLTGAPNVEQPTSEVVGPPGPIGDSALRPNEPPARLAPVASETPAESSAPVKPVTIGGYDVSNLSPNVQQLLKNLKNREGRRGVVAGVLERRVGETQPSYVSPQLLQQPAPRGMTDFEKTLFAQEQQGIEALANRRKIGRENFKDQIALNNELRAQKKALDAQQEQFVQQGEALVPELPSSLSWLANSPTSFFRRSFKSGSRNPWQALRMLAGVQEELGKSDVKLNIAGQEITGKQAIEILQGGKPLSGWFRDVDYEALRQGIIAALQQDVEERLSQ